MDKTIESLLPVVFIFVVVGIIFILDILTQKKYGNKKAKEVLCIFTIAYLIYVVAKITLLGRESVFPRRAWIIPFYSYYKYLSGWQTFLFRQNVQNILMFMPLGFLICRLLDGKKKTWRRRFAVGSAFLISLFVEIMQFVFAIGLLEVDDVLHNTFGAVIGCLLYETVCCLQIHKAETARYRIIFKERQTFLKNIKVFSFIFGGYFLMTVLAYVNHLYHVYVLWK